MILRTLASLKAGKQLCTYCKFRASSIRSFSENGTKSTVLPQHLITDFEFQISEADFKDLSELYLNSLADHLDGLASKGVIERDDFDVEHSGDVLTVNTGIRNMKYVINRQTPNRQMWLSSPLSGPFRYDYMDRSWIYRRTKEKMVTLLDREFKQLYSEDCQFAPFESTFFKKEN
ncbi:frataxin, mitochondrial-like [Symsagittifera roscoffensis]|uniref:frataxin, mitochondrial-like n=1 Tax=Symsagittifera roscoffensis TaxID=84072 RepID=UPI00307C05FD